MSSRSCLVSFILNFLVSIRLSKISLKNYFRQMIFYVDFFFWYQKFFLILELNFSFVTLSIVQFIKFFRVNR